MSADFVRMTCLRLVQTLPLLSPRTALIDTLSPHLQEKQGNRHSSLIHIVILKWQRMHRPVDWCFFLLTRSRSIEPLLHIENGIEKKVIAPFTFFENRTLVSLFTSEDNLKLFTPI